MSNEFTSQASKLHSKNRYWPWRTALLYISLSCLSGTSALAQFSANVQGTITDSSGAVIPNAAVTITNLETGIVSRATSNSSGQYHVNSLAPGKYKVLVEASGFQTKEVTSQVTTQQEAGVDVSLGVGSAAENVTVTADVEGINPQETRVQATLDTQQVRDLPLQSRGTLNLVNTAPGVSGYSEGLDNFAVEQTPGGNANGHYFGGNQYVVDGVSITSNIVTGTGNISPNADSLEEIALQTNTFHMDFPGGSGVTTELTTKSGSNRFHGTANYTFTDQHLRAYSEFVHKYNKFSNKDVSATFGGPIFKDRTFFFGSIEQENNKVTGLNQFAVEDPAFIAYAKQNFPTSVGTSLLTKYPATNVNRNGVQLYATPDFLTTCATPAGSCATPFIDSASSATSPYVHGLQYSVRGDQYFRQGKDRVYGYYYNIKRDSQEINSRPGFNQVDTNRSWFTSINYTHVFSSNVLNQAQFAAYKVEGALPGGADKTIPFIHINNQESVTGFGGGWGPGSFIQHNYSWRDVVSYVRGKHDFKFGATAQHGDDSANFGPVQARPQFGFNSLTDFIQDKVYDEGGLSFDPLTGRFKPLEFGVQGTTLGLFAEDQWKLTPNFSLTLGLRYDDFGNPYTYGYKSYSKFANVYIAGPSTTLAKGSALDAQFANASVKQNSNVFQGRQSNNFTPRVAFAWQPYASGKTSVHGGVGMYRDQITLGQVVDGLRGNPPGWIFPFFSPTQPIQAIFSLGTTKVAPYGYVYPTLPATGLDEHGGVPGAGAGITGIDPRIKIPKTLNYTLGVTTELPGHFVVGINGVGSSAYDQLSGTDFNRSAGDLIRNNGKLTRLNPSFSGINYVSNLSSSNYYGLIFTMNQRVHNLNYQASYTWSHVNDYGTCATRFDYNGGLDCPQDQHNFQANYGPSSFDVRQNFKLSGSYTVPTPHIEAVVNHVLGGWEIASIATTQSGSPFTAVNYNNYNATCDGTDVTCGGDYNADGYNQDRPNFVGVQAGGFTRKQFISGVFGDKAKVNTTFTRPLPGTDGNEGRNIFRNPGLLVIDASMIKNNKIPWFGAETSNLQVRVDFFNVLNRVNLRSVDYNVGSNNFGRSQETFQPRVIQLGARFQF